VGLTGDGGLEVRLGFANRQARRRIPHRLEILEVTVRMAGLTSAVERNTADTSL
jgi:hypothetical protein